VHLLLSEGYEFLLVALPVLVLGSSEMEETFRPLFVLVGPLFLQELPLIKGLPISWKEFLPLALVFGFAQGIITILK
jgi:hypothetical protein